MAIPQRTALTLPDPRGVEPTIEMAKWPRARGMMTFGSLTARVSML